VDLKRKSVSTFRRMEGNFIITVSPEMSMLSHITDIVLTTVILDFKLSPCSEYTMFSFG